MKIYAVVLAAGKGTRMKSDKPKVVHEVLYKPMINHVVDELKKIGADETIVVVGHEAEQVKALLDDSVTAVYQKEQLGTGHAVLMAKEALGDKEGMTLILCGDAPLIRAETLQGMIEAHEKNHNMGTVMTADCDTSTHYGRIVKEDGQVTGIVEFKDLQPDQMDITEMNTGEYCFDNKALFEALEEVSNEKTLKLYYKKTFGTVQGTDAQGWSDSKLYDEIKGNKENDSWVLHGGTLYLKPFQRYVDITGWASGSSAKVKSPSVEGTRSNQTVIYSYYKFGETSTLPDGAPTEKGHYTVKASVKAGIVVVSPKASATVFQLSSNAWVTI